MEYRTEFKAVGYDRFVEVNTNTPEELAQMRREAARRVAVKRAARREMFTGREVLSRLWAAACKFDRIPSTSFFVVFSEENKAAKLYNSLVLELMPKQEPGKAFDKGVTFIMKKA